MGEDNLTAHLVMNGLRDRIVKNQEYIKELESRLAEAEKLPKEWRFKVDKWMKAKNVYSLTPAISEVSRCANELEVALRGGDEKRNDL